MNLYTYIISHIPLLSQVPPTENGAMEAINGWMKEDSLLILKSIILLISKNQLKITFITLIMKDHEQLLTI